MHLYWSQQSKNPCQHWRSECPRHSSFSHLTKHRDIQILRAKRKPFLWKKESLQKGENNYSCVSYAQKPLFPWGERFIRNKTDLLLLVMVTHWIPSNKHALKTREQLLIPDFRLPGIPAAQQTPASSQSSHGRAVLPKNKSGLSNGRSRAGNYKHFWRAIVMHWSVTQPHESCVNSWLLLDPSSLMKNRKGNKDHAGTATALQCQLHSYHTQTRIIKYIVRTQGNKKYTR